jgi:diketogulonate reductase-like aldo/keto reductase
MMGERPAERQREVAALRRGFELGLTLVDTAEMYASGGAEEVVAEAVAGRRDEVTIVSKVLPDNASRHGTVSALEASLRRLRTDHLDLYLLHWPGPHPLAETLEAFAALAGQGKIRAYGVSNFDHAELLAARARPEGGRIAANQILYNPLRRGAERKLIPWCQEAGIVIMAYSPLEQMRLPPGGALARVAARHAISVPQAALAWVLRSGQVIAIPKAVHPAHVEANARAATIHLDSEDLEAIDAEFPVPRRDLPLEMI